MFEMFRGYKTLTANTVLSIPLAIEAIGQIANAPMLQNFIPAHWLPYYGLGLGILNLILRFNTTTPVGKSTPPTKKSFVR